MWVYIRVFFFYHLLFTQRIIAKCLCFCSKKYRITHHILCVLSVITFNKSRNVYHMLYKKNTLAWVRNCLRYPLQYSINSLFLLPWRDFSSSLSITLSLCVALQPNADQGRLISEVSKPYTVTHHSRYFSSGRGIGPSWRSLPSNTQQSQETDIYAPAGFDPAISASEQPKTLALGHSATGIGDLSLWWYKIMYVRVHHHQ
jgi:hypothetical protein